MSETTHPSTGRARLAAAFSQCALALAAAKPRFEKACPPAERSPPPDQGAPHPGALRMSGVPCRELRPNAGWMSQGTSGSRK